MEQPRELEHCRGRVHVVRCHVQWRREPRDAIVRRGAVTVMCTILLTFLSHRSLPSNQLNGTIPTSIGSLTALTTL
jgi:hypothetical protein